MIEPLFSIIVPVYNAEEYLVSCIESILKQSYSDFQLILVNDGSTDNSEKICNDFALKDARIKKVKQNNLGVSTARNTGILKASGRYITFIDADDFIEVDYLNEFANLISKYDYDLIISGTCMNFNGVKENILFYTDKKSCRCTKDISDVIPILEDKQLLSGPYVKCFKNVIIKENNISFNKKFHFGEDAIFNLNYLMFVESVRITDYVGYNYMQRGNDSLVSKKYSFEDTMNFAEVVTTCRYKIENKFKTVDESYLNIIRKQYALHALSAMFSVYSVEFKRDRFFRLRKWKMILKEIHIDCLPKTSLYFNMIQKVLKTKNVYFIDLFFSFFFLVRNEKV